jgi:hypothetical protein
MKTDSCITCGCPGDKATDTGDTAFKLQGLCYFTTCHGNRVAICASCAREAGLAWTREARRQAQVAGSASRQDPTPA